MSRLTLLRMLGLAAVAVVAILCWRIIVQPEPTGDLQLSPEIIESNRLLAQWRKYALAKKAVSQDPLRPRQVVELLNKHSPQFAKGEAISFVLWDSTMAPPRDFKLNPQPVDKGLAISRHLSWLGGRSLYAQTQESLDIEGFRAMVIDGEGFVCPRDAFVPRLITRQLTFASDVAAELGLPSGSIYASDLRWYLQLRGISMPPGTSAVVAPDGKSMTLCVEELDLERASELLRFDDRRKTLWQRVKITLRGLRDRVGWRLVP